MTAVMKDEDWKSGTRVQEKQWLGRRNAARCWIVVSRKVQQIHQAEIHMLLLDLLGWSILLDRLCWLSQQPHIRSWKLIIRANAFSQFRFSSWITGTRWILANTLCWLFWQPHVSSWNLKVSWKLRILANASVSSEFGGNVISQFRFSSWITGTGCILANTFCWLSWQPRARSWNLKVSWKLRIQANASVSSEFGSKVLSQFRFSSWMTGTRCILANTFCWLSRQPRVRSWNLKVYWKHHIRANATVSSEFGGYVFLQFWFCNKLDDWIHLIGYLDNLMPILGILKCLGNSAFEQMLLSPQNLVATCSRNFDFQVGWLEAADAFWATFCSYFAAETIAYEVT